MSTHEERFKPSIYKAREFFHQQVLPRRIEDRWAEVHHNAEKHIYRKLEFDEEDRGEAYPVCTAFFDTFSHFGVGIGIYFMQLVYVAAVYLLGGMIMMVAVKAYLSPDYGAAEHENGLIRISGACPTVQNVTATVGCDNGAPQCFVSHRPRCDIPYNAGVADMLLSMFMLVAIVLSKIFEAKVIEKLDEALQTAQDYSVEVADPDYDADDPDKWYRFFSRFGSVRYITITRKNYNVCKAALKLHEAEKALEDRKEKIASGFTEESGCCVRSTIRLEQDVVKASSHLLELCQNFSYDVCKVYVTFDHEDSQRLCLSELEVPDIDAILDTGGGKERVKYMGTKGPNVLDVTEPPEPDNIIWRNMEVHPLKRRIMTFIVNMLSLGILICTYYLILEARKVSVTVLAIAIGCTDSVLPVFFQGLIDMAAPRSEGSRQNQLQIKLFITRLMLATVFPYLQSDWRETLDPDFIKQILQVQIFATFTGPVVALLDVAGIIHRNIYAPLVANTQEELNSKWLGSEWAIADRYTSTAKIQFVSLYYALLTPIGLLISSAALVFSFLVDRFLLLRRWKPVPMIDAKIATRMRQQFLLGVCLHMWVSLRFIYSWPMDDAYFNKKTEKWEKVNKYASYNVFKLGAQNWQTEGQKDIFEPYFIMFCMVFAAVVYVWVLLPFLEFFHKMFFRVKTSVGKSQGIAFSSLERCAVYVPLFRRSDDEQQYLCSYIKDLLPQHKPSLLNHGLDKDLDLSKYIPVEKQPYVLSVVKYYGDSTGLIADFDDVVDPNDDANVAAIFTSNPAKSKVLTTDQEGKLKLEEVGVEGLPESLMEKIRGTVMRPSNSHAESKTASNNGTNGFKFDSKHSTGDDYDSAYPYAGRREEGKYQDARSPARRIRSSSGSDGNNNLKNARNSTSSSGTGAHFRDTRLGDTRRAERLRTSSDTKDSYSRSRAPQLDTLASTSRSEVDTFGRSQEMARFSATTGGRGASRANSRGNYNRLNQTYG